MESRKKIQLKPRLTVAKIGKFRFWLGIGLGGLSATVFYVFTFYLLDFMMVMNVSMGGDLSIVPTETSFFEKSFLIATSLTVGVTMMIRHWFMQATFHFQRSRKKITLRLSNYSVFLVYLVFYVASVFIRFSYLDIDFTKANQFIKYNSLLFIIPLYLFFAAWTEVSRYFKTRNWIPYTFFISLFIITLLSFMDIKPQGFSGKAFLNMHAEEFKYIDSEVEKAKHEYDISFSEETINSLKQLRTENAFNQLEKVRLAFKTDGKVSLDTIILEKILIHNFKGFYKDSRHTYAYVFPFHVYKQLRKVAPTSQEATELLNILAEFHDLGIYMMSLYDVIKTISASHQNKISALSNEDGTIYDFGNSFNYDRMFDQTSFLLYHIQKLGTYNHHPLFDTEIPFPPPISYSRKRKSMLPPPPPTPDSWIQENFPEFYY